MRLHSAARHLGERAIEIVAAEEEVAVGREHLEDLAVDAQDATTSNVPPPKSNTQIS